MSKTNFANQSTNHPQYGYHSSFCVFTIFPGLHKKQFQSDSGFLPFSIVHPGSALTVHGLALGTAHKPAQRSKLVASRAFFPPLRSCTHCNRDLRTEMSTNSITLIFATGLPVLPACSTTVGGTHLGEGGRGGFGPLTGCLTAFAAPFVFLYTWLWVHIFTPYPLHYMAGKGSWNIAKQ